MHAFNRRRFLAASSATVITASSLATLTPLAAQTNPLPGATGDVYTADEKGHTVSQIELATGRVTTVPLSIAPHNVQVTDDGRWLLAVGDPTDAAAGGRGHAHGASSERGRLLVFDASRLARGPVAEVAVGMHAAHVVADAQGRRAFVTHAGDNTVGVIDLERRVLVSTIKTGRYPHGLRISPDGRWVHVANVRDGTVSVIDTRSLAEVARIPVGLAPVQVGYTPDGSRLYVSLRDADSVAVIDVASRKVLGTTKVGSKPIQVHATPDGRHVYVANQGTTDKPADTVSVIEVASGRVIDTLRTGWGAHGVAVSRDGARVFVSNIVDGSVSVIDTGSRRVVASYKVGAGPNGITHRPAGPAPGSGENRERI
jgi:YVTN family beta-propeller protein